jgi:hypothetical protein
MQPPILTRPNCPELDAMASLLVPIAFVVRNVYFEPDFRGQRSNAARSRPRGRRITLAK